MKKKKLSIVAILPRQARRRNHLALLKYYIWQKDLSSALILLETAGYSAETALFILAYIQTAEVAV
jgi:hypothetical protein